MPPRVVRAAGSVPPAPPPPTGDWREQRRKAEEFSKNALKAQEAQAAAHRASTARKVELPEGSVTPLADIEFTPFLDSDGLISDLSDAGAKASAYAIYDQDKNLQFIGVSRAIQPSLRLHLGRFPNECHFVRVQHISRPSRALLDGIRDHWLAAEGAVPPGHASEEAQALWEGPLNVIPLLTEEESAAVKEAPEGPQRIKAIKAAARRIAAGKKEALTARGMAEDMRFDPNLMAKGLLDLKCLQEIKGPDTAVPSNN